MNCSCLVVASLSIVGSFSSAATLRVASS